MIAIRKNLPVAFTALAVFCLFASASLGAAEPRKTDPEDPVKEILKRLERIESMLAAQGRKVDRLYDAFEPYLAEMEQDARSKRKQDEEDRALAMSEVLRQEVEDFTGKLLLLPNTKQLLLAYGDASLRVVELPSGKSSATVDGLDGIATCLAAGRGSRFVYAGTRKGTVYRCDLHERKAMRVCETGGWPVDSLAASADGRFFAWATNGRSGKDKKWDEPEESANVMNAKSGAKLFGMAVGRGDWQALSFSSDGNSVAVVQSGEGVLADTSTGRVKKRLRHPDHQSGPLSVAYSPAQPVVAIGYAPYHVALWDPASGKCLKLLKGHSN